MLTDVPCQGDLMMAYEALGRLEPNVTGAAAGRSDPLHGFRKAAYRGLIRHLQWCRAIPLCLTDLPSCLHSALPLLPALNQPLLPTPYAPPLPLPLILRLQSMRREEEAQRSTSMTRVGDGREEGGGGGGEGFASVPPLRLS